MAWIVLVLSGFLETAWAIALDRSQGFSRPLPTVVFAVTLLASMAGLGYALNDIPIGTGYAVWVGIGAVGTALVGMVWLDESVNPLRIGCLLLVVAGVVGLKVFH
jgi:quaternary ammonium compound-resistance protein SugE